MGSGPTGPQVQRVRSQVSREVQRSTQRRLLAKFVPFFPGVNNSHVTCSGLRAAVATAVNISHYLKLRNRIFSQVMGL